MSKLVWRHRFFGVFVFCFLGFADGLYNGVRYPYLVDGVGL